MKKAILFIVCAAFSIQMQAQSKSKNVDYTFGPEQKINKKTHLVGQLTSDAAGLYLESYKYKGFKTLSILDLYDNNMNKKLTGVYDQTYTFYTLGDKILRTISEVDEKNKKNCMYVETINKKTLQPNGDKKKLAEIEYDKKRNSGNFSFVKSNNESKILIYSNLPYEKKENEKFEFNVYDKDFKLQWKKTVTLPYSDELFTIYSYEVDNQGVVHILGKKYKEKVKEERKGAVNYTFVLLSYYKNGNELKEYPIEVEGKFLKDMNISIPNEDEILCTGFYSLSNSTGIKGAYYLRINTKDKKVLVKSFKEFSFSLITENMTEKQKKKAKKKEEKGKELEMYSYEMRDIVLRDDGSAILVAEQYYYYVTSYTVTNSNGTTTTRYVYHYYYNDILVININTKGEIEWSQKIPKYQYTTNDGGYFSSYAMSLVGSDLYFVFNDNPKNLLNTDNNRIYSYGGVKNNVAVLVKVDSKGNMSKEALFLAKDAGVIIRPKVSSQINDNQMILYGQLKKKERFVKLTFK